MPCMAVKAPWDPGTLMSRESRPEGDTMAIVQAMIEEATDMVRDERSDTIQTMWYETDSGLQAVAWPMRLHRHDQDCNRA